MGLAQATTAELRQQVLSRPRKTSKRGVRGPKSTTVAAYTGVFLLVMSMVALGYQPPQKVDSVANAVSPQPVSINPITPAAQPSVDQLVATNVAADIAERANLPIARNIASLSLSLSAESQLAQTSTANVIVKPQIVQPTASGRAIQSYTAQAGDTVAAVAEKYSVDGNTVKWANNLSSDAIEAGKQLSIPPSNGVLYTVKDGDTIESLATKYHLAAQSIITFNDLELGGLTVGNRIFLPGGVLPETERPGYVAPRAAVSQGSYLGGYSTVNAQIATASAGNRYAFGNCTWYAYERRAQLGRPVGSFWGNASTWAAYAAAAGFGVSKTPTVGSVIQNGGGYGHVGIIESVNPGESVTISEMNYAGNFNRVTSRTMSWAEATSGRYSFIE